MISGADECWKHPSAPHHVTPNGAAISMADQKSSTLPVHSRSSNGTPLFRRVCRICGAVAIVDRRRINKRCHRCAMTAKRTHGLASGGHLHPLYRLLHGMVIRCEQPRTMNYKYYGGRGVSVCAEWRQNPAAFVAWAMAHGWSSGLEIDRLDVDGDYAPDNCRFINHRENSQRTRRIKTTPQQVQQVRSALVSGLTLKQAAAQAGVTYMVAWHIKNSPGVWSNVP
jgi:hypothetical protein